LGRAVDETVDLASTRLNRREGYRSLSAGLSTVPIAKPLIGEEEKAAVLRVLESGMLTQGPEVAALESEFAGLLGVRHAIATSSGTTALHLALLAHGIGLGDEVVTSSFTFVASVNSILYTGAKPIFADIDPITYTIDGKAVEAAVTSRTRAVLPVHLYGQISDMDSIMSTAEKHGLVVIEDAAQAIGASYRGRSAGSFGTGCFSLYATKNVMSGEGGLISTNNDEIAQRVRLLRQHGMRRRYAYEQLGFNFRLTDICAAIARVQLRRLNEITARRRENAAFLTGAIQSVAAPLIPEDDRHVWHQYTVRLGKEQSRDDVVRRLGQAGIGSGVFYPQGVHDLEHIRAIVGRQCLPSTEQAAREVLSLPVHPALSQDDLAAIVEAVNQL
jgi:dTDP-4-amino-4,6-dideoxygalactose transaminase